MARSRVRGVNKLRRTLKRMGPEATAEVREALADGAEKILQSAKDRVPVDTGNLQQLLSAKSSGDGMSARIGLRGKRANRRAFYGRFIEFGTKIRAARPFLVPAFEQNKDGIVARLRVALDRVLTRISSAGGLD